MVKSLVSKLSSASNISLTSTLSSVGVGHGSSSQETNYAKHRNDPGRFFGDGVQFKAKLIGILEVGEARGDRMCQEALQDLKMAIRAAGEHKQRITIHVTIDGLRLRDEKTGDSLYHHPVHKISFIAQDMTDSRAFGYIFGSPDSGHRFFGIKTDKAASQVVLAMRDLFQVVFELKKKEIELARQQIQSKSIHEHHLASLSSLKSASGGGGGGHNDLSSSSAGLGGSGGLSSLSGLGGGAGSSHLTRLGSNLDAKGASKEMSPESVADLVDLEQELSSIQRGITQMERITPNDPTQPQSSGGGGGGVGKDEDPFGDSFTNFPQTYNLLPPPESGRSRNKPSNKPTDPLTSGATAGAGTSSVAAATAISTLLSPANANERSSPPTHHHSLQADEDDSWLKDLDTQNDCCFDPSKTVPTTSIVISATGTTIVGLSGNSSMPLAPLAASESTSTPTQQLSENSAIDDVCITATSLPLDMEQYPSVLRAVKSDAFTDLDPLGTGRTRPYVDKKYFFQELKNPPKKVLKDLSSSNSITTTIITTTTTTTTTTTALTTTMTTTTPTLTFPTGGGIGGGVGGSIDLIASSQNTKTTIVDEFSGLFVETTAITLPKIEEYERLKQQQQQVLIVSNLTAIHTTNSNNNNNNSKLSTDPSDALVMPGEAVMLPRDTDPFSPTRKKSDPFQEGDIFSKLDPFDIEFSAASASAAAGTNSSDIRSSSPTNSNTTTTTTRRTNANTEVFNGPLQVNLPPERSISPPNSNQVIGGGGVGGYWKGDTSRSQMERQMSASPTFTGENNTSIRSRPTPSSSVAALATPSSMLKQQTVDVISSISNKKMPHLFGQARFSKRSGGDSAVNMRRLQESDSLSENETAPEPPPRPDSALHVEPPPLPPKKQFNDIVIRPRVTSGNAVPPSTASNSLSIMSSSSRYEFISSAPSSKQTSIAGGGATDVPPIPLPSRRIGRSDGSYPGPGRPRKPGHIDDDYLAPLGGMNTTSAVASTCAGGAGGVAVDAIGADVPPLLPPPQQVSTRGRTQRLQSFKSTHELYENKSEILQQQQQQQQQQQAAEESASIIPDITLSQLLTLGIDELAVKLNVPTSKLSTMTLVELTSYLSEFIEKSTKPTISSTSKTPKAGGRSDSVSPKPKPKQANQNERSSVFKVNFDAQTTFVAKFDDTFGEDLPEQQQSRNKTEQHSDTFVANFEQFNEPLVAPPIVNKAGGAPAVPSADRYAVFREIIDQELQTQRENVDLIGMSDLPTPPAAHSHASITDADEIAHAESKTNGSSNYELHFPETDADDFLGPQSSSNSQPPPTLKIDTKITEVVAQAKDRYAALRDIILVENLFEKKPSASTLSDKDFSQECPEFSDEFTEDQDVKQIMKNRFSSGGDRLLDSRGLPAELSSSAVTVDEEDDEEDDDAGGESSLDSNDKESSATRAAQDNYEKLSTSNQQLDIDQLSIEKAKSNDAASSNSNLLSMKQDSKYLTVSGAGSCLSASKDDLEIDELMQRAISNLSLDSRERVSPATSTGVVAAAAAAPRSTSAMLSSTQSPIPSSTGVTQQQRSPISLSAANGSMHATQKSQQISPITAQLAVVSNLIDTATKHLSSNASIELIPDAEAGVPRKSGRKEAWATFDSPKTSFPNEAIEKQRSSRVMKTSKASLHLPPAPPSNTSQNDTAESPCSSDPRDDGWGKGRRCWPKAKDRQQTSSSSRDLSPWDDEATDYVKQQQKQRMMAGQPPGPGHPPHADRHGYYMRHARRMNSCDEDYEYEEDFGSHRDQRKFKQGLSRSRDNFDLDSPSWYHHPAHHTWSPQDVEQTASASRMRSFERSAYERTTYGPPIYDKRVGVGGVGGGVACSSYDRRGGGFEKRKYYRDYLPPRSNYEFNEYGDRDERYREPPGAFDKPKIGRRSDYENVYDDGRSPMSLIYGGVGGVGGGSRARAEYGMYERERKSFDRGSVESFESATRRRRSFGSGDVYGSLESREEFRERYMGGGVGDLKSRSLRKGIKLRATGDIDYEQDSENDYHQQRSRGSVGVGSTTGGGVLDARSLQRPSQLVSGSGGVGGNMSRMRKSSGSSPWDGEEPPLPGQKSAWKRPGSAVETDRRLTESRRVAAMGQTPSGSDGEKDRRFRKKTRIRGGKDYVPSSSSGVPVPIPPTSSAGGSSSARYGSAYTDCPGPYAPGGADIDNDDDDDEDYVDEEYDEPPTDEDKFERLNRRRHEMHQRMLESERRQHVMSGKGVKTASGGGGGANTYGSSAVSKRYHHHHNHHHHMGPRNASLVAGPPASYELDDYDEQTPTPRSNASSAAHPVSGGGSGSVGGGGGSSTKFSFDGGGFESDFNQSSPPPAPAGTASSCQSTPAATTSGISATATKSSFRFSNDFSEREKSSHFAAQNSTSVSSLQQFELDTATSPASHTQKLRFDDKVKVSQFDDAAFEDDFSKAPFDFSKNEEQWQQVANEQPQSQSQSNIASATAASATATTQQQSAVSVPVTTAATVAKKQNLRNSKFQQRQQELIKKSESINIFAKKAEDPFEDDEFFSSAPANEGKGGAGNEANESNKRSGGGNNNGNGFQWESENNFAKFDENM